MTSEAAHRALNALLRGVAHDTSEDIRDGWKRLKEMGGAAVPVVCEKLCNSDWSDYLGRTQARYLTILLLILSELDASICEQEIERLGASNIHDLHARTISIFRERMNDDVFAFECRGVSIRIDAQLSDPEDIRTRFRRWMQVPPPEAFEHLQKIDIVPVHPDFDYLGLHSYRYSGIVVTWLPDGTSGLMRRLELFATQGTLYHEIGHSFHLHSEPGQVVEQEDAANAYQRKMLRRAYPVTMFCLRLLSVPFRRAVGLFIQRSKKSA